MPEDWYMVAIAALLPLTACMLVLQVNPYHALVIRGILGAVAALVYALFGAADVALTEALVGTMLSITLYAVAVRSSMSMRLGVLEPQADPPESLLMALREVLRQHQMRLERVPYANLSALRAALEAQEIHAACIPGLSVAQSMAEEESTPLSQADRLPHLQIRVRRLHDIMQAELPPGQTRLIDTAPFNLAKSSDISTADSIGGQL
ncbi:DUF4040 domain-containing protein [Romeria aff. gracilis LEGE 07310]|uniref:DUF4040 domain-containing protein n=1 Tax=Vasconcelosia minhoensis LEGE 07310 TaxID=915328 RepID=A0A8J7D9U8_9CYAN|nr:DUF4040 domain-containing protein [Romeria gracilis]MBE9075727.1 DUF4040 domain-containing protein [Romeria aff. gracilis LEGE 07310]